MKKLICFLLIAVMMSSIAVLAENNEIVVTLSYKSSYGGEQGINNWYFCQFSGGNTEELAYSNRYWRPVSGANYPTFGPSDSLGGYMTPDNSVDVGLKFIAPSRGMVRLKGEAYMPQSTASNGNGATAKLYKGEQLLWSKKLGYGSPGKYDLITSIRTGEEFSFRICADGANAFDTVVWWPTVDYLDMEYVAEEGEGIFCQKKGSEIKELDYNSEKDGYVADDGVAFISHNEAMPSEDFSLVRRWIIEEEGRYRIKGIVETMDERGSGHLLTVYRNGKEIWKQMLPKGEVGKYDIRLMANKEDVIDVELDDIAYTGYNYARWTCDVAEYFGTAPFCQTISSAGHTNMVFKECSLGSIIGTSRDNGSAYYSVKNDVKRDMVYNAQSKKWESTFEGTGGYISKTEVSPGRNADSVFEIKVNESGIIRICGDMKGDSGDGVLSKIFLNDKLLWSSRVGGERYVRWDEPYDTSYFVNYVDVIANVNIGDKLKFTFNQWRKCENDHVDISGVKISYIGGNILSKTTKWKIDNSIVIDTKENCVYRNGIKESVAVVIDNGTNYIAKSDIVKVFGENVGNLTSGKNINGTEYVSVRDVAESADKNIIWVANRLVIVYDGIPVLFGYSELSEIAVALKGGGLFD